MIDSEINRLKVILITKARLNPRERSRRQNCNLEKLRLCQVVGNPTTVRTIGKAEGLYNKD